eukprot:CAMPEP_0194516538 /NCGR_PEP_ID=MMETSP0253-20130528/49445_1 /TAXON_ID=2966 /ORGANISM="Noctiluca scintillans" /LENGTH=263 /DNA_ID=CAMNT_0039360401 /DNA_START=23 /DNA_END=811 /DNA_ORIENTATION=-
MCSLFREQQLEEFGLSEGSVAPKTAEEISVSHEGKVSENVVAMDCEMVGVGVDGLRSVLARVSVVDHNGTTIFDAFVRPKEEVTDYRTWITGITKATLDGPRVLLEDVARQRASELLQGKVVVGHALQNDFAALNLDHPLTMIRDTCRFRPLRIPGKEKMTPSLKRLAAHWLHINIQDGQHDSVEDSRIALRLYRLKCSLWERMMRGAMRSGRQEDEQDDDSDDEGEPVEEEVEARKVEPLPVEKDGNLGKKARAQKRKRETA